MSIKVPEAPDYREIKYDVDCTECGHTFESDAREIYMNSGICVIEARDITCPNCNEQFDFELEYDPEEEYGL